MNERHTIKNISLIGGTGRSGTTLIANIYKKHPQVAVAPEWRFLVDPDGILDFYQSCDRWSPYHFDLYFKRLCEILRNVSDDSLFLKIINKVSQLPILNGTSRKIIPPYFGVRAVKYAPNYRSITEKFIQELTDFSYSGFWVGTPFLGEKLAFYSGKRTKSQLKSIIQAYLYSLFSDVLQANESQYYLEKNTWNILWFDEILELLPQAKLLHVYRDPRDVIASFVTQTWMPSDPIHSAIIVKHLHEQWEVVKKNVPKESYLEVSLESLVKTPDKILSDINQFWGIPWDVSILDVNLSKSNSGRWKKQFNQKQQKEIDNVIGEKVRSLGYE